MLELIKTFLDNLAIKCTELKQTVEKIDTFEQANAQATRASEASKQQEKVK